MARELIKENKRTPYHAKTLFESLPYSYYAYGVYHGCQLAKSLKIGKVSVIEFGVTGGNGLVAMEQHARETEKLTAKNFHVLR